MNVDLTELRDRLLPSCEFAQRAFRVLEGLHVSPGYHRRQGAIKPLVEEVVPLAVFARYLEVPERRVKVRYRGQKSERIDAELRLSGGAVRRGFYPRLLRVEITVAAEQRAYLQRELLAQGKSVFMGPGIRRSASRHLHGSTIDNFAVAQAGGRGADECAALVRAAVQKKAARIGRRKRLLLVSLEPEPIMRVSDWRRLAQLSFDREACGKFQAVYVVETSSGTVLQIS